MSRRSKNILWLSVYLLIILVAIYLMVTFVGQRVQVIGTSMEPTLTDADQLLVDKLTFKLRDPKRFEIIVFPYIYEKNTYYIKRVIGLPGEEIYIDNEGNIYINGEILKEGYGKEIIRNPGLAYEPIKLADDEYFVMGDNRNDSADSRDPNVGNIKKSSITGRAFIRLYPFNKMGVIKHK